LAKIGFGTTLTWDSVVIAELTNINGVEISTDMVDVSTHQSANGFKEYLPAMMDSSEVVLQGFFAYDDTTGQHAMLADQLAKAVKAGIITFPAATGATWSFNGYVTKFKIGDAAIDNGIPFTASIKITGLPTFAVATSTGLTTPFFSISESAVITPDAIGNVYEFVATVLTAIASVVVTPTAAAGVITVNGSTVATGQASSAITLGAADTITVITIVVTETSKAPLTYRILLTRL
jgi:hypothetical protein